MDSYTRSRFIQAIDKFNQKDFFECHEILEDIWFDTRDDSRDFYRGMLHIAVGLYHLTKKSNPKGTIIQLNKAIVKLSHYKDNYNDVNLKKLKKEIKNIITELEGNKKPLHLPEITLQ
jgi:predicted metal-dependent hydrolase